MEEEFVTYPIALMLKELSYNKSCFAFYLANNYLRINQYKDSENKNSAFYNQTVCSAPLWQDVIDWLADERKVYIEVKFADKAFTMYEFYVYRNFEELVQCAAIAAKLGDNRPVYRSKFKAREQATLKAIELCQK